MHLYSYADDSQVMLHCKPDSAPSRIVEMEQEISQWMAKNRLKLNPDKTEFLWTVLAINSINCLHRVLLLLALVQLNR